MGAICLWSLSTLNELDLLLALDQLVVAVADSRRGKRLLNYCFDNTAAQNNHVWLLDQKASHLVI